MRQGWNRKEGREQLHEETKAGVTFLTFPALSDAGIVRHAFSTRLGGVSEGKYATMNFAFTRGDQTDHVLENYRRMAAAMGVEMSDMVLSWQTHTTTVRKVTRADAGKGVMTERDYRDVDGLITDVPGITLVTFYADCVPLYVVDPAKQAIGLSHSGWRGTVNRMAKVTIEAMNREYASRPEDLVICIGPSICQTCFEVGEEVVSAFQQSFDEIYWDTLSYPGKTGKHQLDLWRANEIICREAGVPPEQIHITDICTHCNPKLLFSHRSSGEERGNLAAFLCLC